MGESLTCRFVDVLIVGLCEMGNVWRRKGHGGCMCDGWMLQRLTAVVPTGEFPGLRN